MSEEGILHCYELLSMQYLEQSQNDDVWHKLVGWFKDQISTVEAIVSLPKELWFIAVLLRENPARLREFLAKFANTVDIAEDLLVTYLKTFHLTELHLDTTFRSLECQDPSNSFFNSSLTHNVVFRPPLAIFRCCPNVTILSLKNNNLDHIPPDIGRMSKLKKLHLTNNRLQNRSIPYTLAFCGQLQELYLDDNLLDALPSVLLRMPTLTTVHRHGNHNYFKSTFMWYHTDLTGRILPSNPSSEADYSPAFVQNVEQYELVNLQNIAARAIIASRINFYAAEIPYRLKNYISDMVNSVSPCENCFTVKNINEPGFKVFTFKNPYLGNTCVPFLHWACDFDCAKDIEIPARQEQIMTANEQEKQYQDHVRQAVDLLPTFRSLSHLNDEPSLSVVPIASSHQDELELPSSRTGQFYGPCQIL